MLNPNSPTPCGVLYVDDEEKALKYFRMALSPTFPIFTAASAAEGLDVLRREAGRIGIVLSDQRMPGMKGAEFLGLVRDEFPFLVRILTTAYSELDSAIAAVNTGHIYQYVVKPWGIPELVMVLQRAADYFHVLTERNGLLALKMTALQRILCSDRVKWLLVWSRGLAERERADFRRALAALIAALPDDAQKLAVGGPGRSARQFEISHLLHDEYRHASACLEAFEQSPAPDDSRDDEAVATLGALLAGAVGGSPADVVVETDAAGGVRLRVRTGAASFDAAALSRGLFAVLIGSEDPALSLALFQLLRTRAAGSRALAIVVEAAAMGATYDFPAAPIPAEPGAVIDLLCEKFAAEDISRL